MNIRIRTGKTQVKYLKSNLARYFTSKSLIFNKYEETDFYNSQESKPLHPLLKEQETRLKKGQVILSNQVLSRYKNSKNKSTYFMDIGEKHLIPCNLKPWIKHQIIQNTYNSQSNITTSNLQTLFFLWKKFNLMSRTTDSNLLMNTNYKNQNWFKSKRTLLSWLRQKNILEKETLEFPYFYYGENNGEQIISLPHITRQLMYYNSTWTWLSRCWKKKHIITGRIGRSLRHAGVCILIGGFIGFLPKREYTLRNKKTLFSQNMLKSIQPIGLRYQNLNIVVTRDKSVQSTWYRFSKRKFM